MLLSVLNIGTKMNPEKKRIKSKIRCLENSEGIVHAWKCTCKEHYWASDKGKTDKKYNEYKTWKNKQK